MSLELTEGVSVEEFDLQDEELHLWEVCKILNSGRPASLIPFMKMLQICRAEDGEVFQVKATVQDIERFGSLEQFLQKETGVEEQAVIAYLSDGQRLRNDNIRELTGAPDQLIYVYNKRYLDLDLENVLQELRAQTPVISVEDSLNGNLTLSPAQLTSSYLHAAQSYQSYIKHAVSSLHMQHSALRVASSSLDMHILNLVNIFELVASNARPELERQAALLAGIDSDLRIISRVKIHPEFLSPAIRKAIESGEKMRTLGDYVMNVKMLQVAETCKKTHNELNLRFLDCVNTLENLNEESNVVRASASNVRLLEDADASLHRSDEYLDRVTKLSSMLQTKSPNTESLVQELKQLDNALHNEAQQIRMVKNAHTEQCIRALRHIATLNNDVATLPQTLNNLQASFRVKNSFVHIQRLHAMLYAYGATVVEIVRRKEFDRFFRRRAQNILEMMAKLSASERKRRQVYRGEIHGQLPFETRGMDETVPTIDFSPSAGTEVPYSLERPDLDGLLHMLEDLEKHAKDDDDEGAVNAVRECRSSLDKLISRMDNMEPVFDRIAERLILSNSRLSSSRRRVTDADEQAYQELAEQLRLSRQAYFNLEAVGLSEREMLQAEVDNLRSSIQEANAREASERTRADKLAHDLHDTRAQLDSQLAACRILEPRQAELSSDVESLRGDLATALAKVSEGEEAEKKLIRELANVRAELEDAKTDSTRNSVKLARLEKKHAEALRDLEEAKMQSEDLEAQVRAALAEGADIKLALAEVGHERERLLRVQASEHDRILRDHIAEADGDRAVLEHKCHMLEAAHEDSDQRLKELQSKYEVCCSDAVGLKEELQRMERELREVRHMERLLRDDLKAGRASQSDFEQKLGASNHLIAQILEVAIAFRNTHLKAFSTTQAMVAHPNSGMRQSNLLVSPLPSDARNGLVCLQDEPSPIDPTDISSALDALRSFDHDQFLETIVKTGAIIRKWQRQCKEYRERAKGKISFRNFAKGDLALFLPTRNSVSKPWAAFNVSFPHYFLHAAGNLAEQLRSREWIVARITSITERVVNHNEPGSNPYGLGDGVKYYILEVEDWVQQSRQSKRRVFLGKASSKDKEPRSPSLEISPLATAPPEAEVEDTFPLARPNALPSSSRSNSPTAVAAVPSSLSRLLAQAPVDIPPEASLVPKSETPSPATSPPRASPLQTEVTRRSSVPNLPSPLRPGSRASRLSTSSRFSLRGIPPMGSSSGSNGAKAAPTTALSDELSSSLSPDPDVEQSSVPLEASPPESVQGLPIGRQRASYHLQRTSPLASQTSLTNNGNNSTSSLRTSKLVSLATSFGVFGGRKKTEHAGLAAPASEAGPSLSDAMGSTDRAPEASARELLKRF